MRVLIFSLLVIFSLSSIRTYALDTEFSDKLYSLKWVAYAPTNYNPDLGIYPMLSSIEQDLKVLLNAGFTGIITYGAKGTLADIPRLANDFGFKGVIMGIWDIYDREEWEGAVGALNYVDAYCVGNEGLDGRYSIDELKGVMDYLKQLTQRYVTTTEQITDYANERILKLGDWIFPNVHPFFLNIKDPKKAVNTIKHYYKILNRSAKGKPILFKETGFPTKGDTYASEQNQERFFRELEQSGVNFAYFEAFDQYWKRTLDIEPYWGLFDMNRQPKRFIKSKLPAKKEKQLSTTN